MTHDDVFSYLSDRSKAVLRDPVEVRRMLSDLEISARRRGGEFAATAVSNSQEHFVDILSKLIHYDDRTCRWVINDTAVAVQESWFRLLMNKVGK